jgi:hypothetical protein
MGAMETHVMTGNLCLPLRLRRGSVVRCTEGVLWLAFEPARHDQPSSDWMLVSGQARELPAPGRLFITRGCMTPRAVFEVEQPTATGRLARLRRWWSGDAPAVPQAAAARAP